VTKEGLTIGRNSVTRIIDEELTKIGRERGADFDIARFADARKIFEQVTLADDFYDFLTLPAYELLD
jgi:malate synthase